MYIPNNVKRLLDLNLPEGQSCFLWGARKTGKSTFLKEHYKDAIYIDFLQSDIFQAYVNLPSRLRQELEDIVETKIIILDEVQKVPAVLDEVHWLIENKKNLQFILCGSSNRRLKSAGVNLLGGRAWRAQLVPFCYPEIKTLNWDKIFNAGLVPAHYFSKDPERSISAYVYDYILMEVHQEAKLRKRDTFTRFINSIGFSHSEIVNYTNIARDCGVDSKTVRTYFEILEDMYLGYFIYPYRKRLKRQTIQEAPKFYLFDTGVASYLRRFVFKEMVGYEAGKAFEHYIFLELQAYKLLTNKRDDITFWRTKDGLEVDFVIKDLAIEVKISKSIQNIELKGLKAFGEENDHKLHVVCFEVRKRILKFEQKNITVWPVEDFLKALWEKQIWI